MALHPKHPDTKTQCVLGVGLMDTLKIVLLAYVELLIKHKVADVAYFKAALSVFCPQNKLTEVFTANVRAPILTNIYLHFSLG